MKSTEKTMYTLIKEEAYKSLLEDVTKELKSKKCVSIECESYENKYSNIDLNFSHLIVSFTYKKQLYRLLFSPAAHLIFLNELPAKYVFFTPVVLNGKRDKGSKSIDAMFSKYFN